MTLQVLPATEEDIPRLADIVFAAFTSDPLHVAMFPRENQAAFMAWYHQKLRKAMRNPSLRSMKVVKTAAGEGHHEPDIIIAYARWQIPHTAQTETQVVEAEAKQTPFPVLANEPLVDHYVAATDAIRERLVDKSRDFVCQMLATHPEYQVQGAARLLIQHGIKAATEAALCNGAPVGIFLEATPEAYLLYRKFGWEDVDRIEIRLDEYGVPSGGLHCTVAMERRTI